MFMINFISPIFHATPIGKFNMVCATPSFNLYDNYFQKHDLNATNGQK